MKGKRFIFFLLGLAIGVVSIWAMVQSQQVEKTSGQVQQETYISKVVIQAPWGAKNLVYDKEESKPGEFGFYQYQVPESLKMVVDAGLPEGPSSFTVAPYGDIYITDPLNYRVQRFSSEGQFISVIPGIQRKVWDWRDICVDENNNIYLLWDEQRPIVHVGKYDQSGKLLLTYSVTGVQRLGGAAPHIFCDNKGGLFIEFIYGIKGVPPYPSIFQIGTSDGAFTEEEQKKTLRRGSVRTSGLSADTVYETTWKGGVIAQYDSKGNTIREFSETVLGHFEGRDENGNIYTFLMPQDKQNWDIFYPTIRKYDKNGNLLSTVKQEIKRGRCPNLTLRNTMVIDKKGNIYEYCATQNGLTITKWYKQ